MKIKYKHLKLSGIKDKETGKEIPNKALEKLIIYNGKQLKMQIYRYIQNDLTTDQVKKFISMKTFDKKFYDKEYECIIRFRFNQFGDMTLEVIHFGKRDMYKEMNKQQKFINLDKGVIGEDRF